VSDDRVAILESMHIRGESKQFGSATVVLGYDGTGRRWWVNRGDAAARMARSPRRAAFYITECERWDRDGLKAAP